MFIVKIKEESCMDNNIRKIIRIIGLTLSLVLLSIMGKLLYDYNIATRDEMATPVKINKPIVNKVTPNPQNKINKPPFTRDENDMPKSDVKVPEIG